MLNFLIRRVAAAAAVAVLVLTGFACTDGGAASNSQPTPAATATTGPAQAGVSSSNSQLVLASPAFHDGEDIPKTYTCDGSSTSPPLEWSGQPAGTQGFALIVHDPDAPRSGGFTHWVLYDIPAGAARLNPGASPHGTLPTGTRQGESDADTAAYTPPCPPSGGGAHRYVFTLYAVDANLGLSGGKSEADLLKAIDGHVLAQTTLTGRFGH
jgi:Raf kinase inhibitor-like YbhB/YbcL family protein